MAQFDLPDVDAARIGDRQAVFSQPLEMQSDRLPDELLGLRARRAGCDYAREGGYESAPTSRGLLVHYGPGAQRASFDGPDWRRMLPSVPGASSWLGLPATVTRPGFVGWRNCRWLPRCTTCCQPSCSSVWITSRTFTGASVEAGCVSQMETGRNRVARVSARHRGSNTSAYGPQSRLARTGLHAVGRAGAAAAGANAGLMLGHHRSSPELSSSTDQGSRMIL